MSYVITGAFNIVTDFVVLCLPIPYVWKLKTNQSNKIALTGIFGVGFLVCIISIVRLVTLVNVSYQDITYSVVDALIWSMLEPTLGVTLACVPLMRPLFSKIFPDPTARSKKPSKGYGSSGNSGGHRSKPTKDFDSDEFHKIDSREADQYPMHGIGDPEATGSRDDMIHKNNSVVSLPTAAPQRSGRDSQPTVINVKKEWRVESQR